MALNEKWNVIIKSYNYFQFCCSVNFQTCDYKTYPAHGTEALVNPLVPLAGSHILIFSWQGLVAPVEIWNVTKQFRVSLLIPKSSYSLQRLKVSTSIMTACDSSQIRSDCQTLKVRLKAIIKRQTWKGTWFTNAFSHPSFKMQRCWTC